MSEFLAKVVSEYIDKKINSKKDENKDSDFLQGDLKALVEEDIVEMVEKLFGTDFTSMGKIKESLKHKLLEQIQNNTNKAEGELDFEELDQVSGGLHNQFEQDDTDDPR